MKVLVAGWFSFENMNTTAGDLLARDLACEWLRVAGCPYDVAVAKPYTGGIDWKTADPHEYSDVLFVCGPFRKNEYTTSFLDHFAGRRFTGLNLSMLDPVESWNPFDLLLERDSNRSSRADITFLTNQALVPVVGVVLVHPQPQYKERALHPLAHDAIGRLVASRDIALVPIDTCLDHNAGGLRSPSQVESLIARMDLVITTRLHGTVLALKNGVPALVVDPIAGGAKVARQVQTIGWPILHTADALSDQALAESFDFCLTESARSKARQCRDQAVEKVREIREEFMGRFLCLAKNIR
jgi:hypothetical protein